MSHLTREMDRLGKTDAAKPAEGNKEVSESSLRDMATSPEISNREKLDAMQYVTSRLQPLNSEQRLMLTRMMSDVAGSAKLSEGEKGDMRMLMKGMLHGPALSDDSTGKETARLQHKLAGQLQSGGDRPAAPAGLNPLSKLSRDLGQHLLSDRYMDADTLSNVRKADPQLAGAIGNKTHAQIDGREDFTQAMGQMSRLGKGAEGWQQMAGLAAQLPADARPLTSTGHDLESNAPGKGERSLRSTFLMNALKHAQESGNGAEALKALMPQITALPKEQQAPVLAEASVTMRKAGDYSAMDTLHQHVNEHLEDHQKLEVFASYPHLINDNVSNDQILGMRDKLMDAARQTHGMMRNLGNIPSEHRAGAIGSLLEISKSSNLGQDPARVMQAAIPHLSTLPKEDRIGLTKQMTPMIADLAASRPRDQALTVRDLILGMSEGDLSAKEQVDLQLPFMKSMPGIEEKVPVMINCLSLAEKAGSPEDRAAMAKAILHEFPTLNVSLNKGGADQPHYNVALGGMIGLVKSLPDEHLTPELTDALATAHNHHAEGNAEHFKSVMDIMDRAAKQPGGLGKVAPEFHSKSTDDTERMTAMDSMLDMQKKQEPSGVIPMLSSAFHLLTSMARHDNVAHFLTRQMDVVSHLAPPKTREMMQTLGTAFGHISHLLDALPEGLKPQKEDALKLLGVAAERLLPPSMHQTGELLSSLFQFTQAIKRDT